jgi:hypothetical protein
MGWRLICKIRLSIFNVFVYSELLYGVSIENNLSRRVKLFPKRTAIVTTGEGNLSSGIRCLIYKGGGQLGFDHSRDHLAQFNALLVRSKLRIMLNIHFES